jgi:thermitase
MSRGLNFAKWLVAIYAIAMSNAAVAQPHAEAVPGEFILQFDKNLSTVSVNDLSQIIGVIGAKLVSKEHNIFKVQRSRVELSTYSIHTLQQLTGAQIVEPNYIYRKNVVPNDPDLGLLWGMKNIGQKVGKKTGRAGVDINAEQAWDITTGSKNIVVAVIDTGVDYTHPDLAGNIWTNTEEANGVAGVDDDKNGVVDDIHGYNAITAKEGQPKTIEGDPMDDHGHGSHCSGTIAASGNDGIGVVGVAWNASIMGIKFLSAEGSGTLEDAVKAIDYATKMKANIMSNSWGGGGRSEVLEKTIERAREAGILFVAASGNSSEDNDKSAHFPSNYENENVISVAAIDNGGALAWFSNYGKTTVDVAAPGEDIRSTVPGGYDTWSGTSMATPHVSGIAVLLLANEPNMTYADIKKRLIETSTPLAGLRGKAQSNGLVNAYNALTKTIAPPDANDPYNWQTVEASASTAHPYKEKLEEVYEVKQAGAESVAVFFSKFETESGFDFVEFIDANGEVVGKWSGNHSGEFSPAVKGDTIKLKFTTDHIVNGYGFDVSKVAFK